LKRGEFVKRAVLTTICDDYENVDQVILRDVAGKGAKRGFEVARAEIVDALAALMEEGLAKAYRLSGIQPFAVELKAMPGLEVIEEKYATYFLATKKGIDLTKSRRRGKA
jgi:hypothetical protein